MEKDNAVQTFERREFPKELGLAGELSILDGFVSRHYDLPTDAVQTFERREFLKKAVLTGLVLTGGIAGANILGCASRPIGRGESFYAPKRRDEIINKSRLELEDFLLTEEELEGMRFARGRVEGKNTIARGEMNPRKGYSGMHSIGSSKEGTPLCEEWIVADYVKQKGSGLFNRTEYGLVIVANKFKSEKDMKEAKEAIKELKRQYKGEVITELFSRDCFLGGFTGTLKYDITQSEKIWKDYHDRRKEYAKIRKLEVF